MNRTRLWTVLVLIGATAVTIWFVCCYEGSVSKEEKIDTTSAPPLSLRLHTDEEIRKIDSIHGILDRDYLDVVPFGALPRSEVFKKLNLDENKIQDFRWSVEGKSVFLQSRIFADI